MIDFRALQEQIESNIYTIEDARNDMCRFVEYWRTRDAYFDEIEAVAGARSLPIDFLMGKDIVFLQDNVIPLDFPEEFKKDNLPFISTKGYVPLRGRVLFPIKDVRGKIASFTGWDKFNESMKYYDYKTYGYYPNITTISGMENLEEIYRGEGPVFFPEGIGCQYYIESIGFKSLALLGSYMNPYIIMLIKRLGNRAVIIPDMDDSGSKLAKQVKRELPKALIRRPHSDLGKDVDDARKSEKVTEEMVIHSLNSVYNPFSKDSIFQTF